MDLQDLINTGKCIFGGLMERGMDAAKHMLPLSRDLIDSYNRLARDMPLPLPRIDPNILEAFYSAPEETYFKSGCADKEPRPFTPPVPKAPPRPAPEAPAPKGQMEMKMDSPPEPAKPEPPKAEAVAPEPVEEPEAAEAPEPVVEATEPEEPKVEEPKAEEPKAEAEDKPSFDELMALTKKKLQAKADELGCEYKPKDTKAMLAQMIIDAS